MGKLVGKFLLLQTVLVLTCCAGEQMSDFEYIKTKDPEIFGLLDNPIVGRFVAKHDVRQSAANWLRMVVRSDWLPEGIANELQPQRSNFNFSPPRRIDVFRWKREDDGGTLALYEGAGIVIVWSTSSIAVTNEPEKQARILLQAVLQNFRATGDVKLVEHLKGHVLQGNISKRSDTGLPSSWCDNISFWIAEGLFVVKIMQITPEAMKKAAHQARASETDRLRFNDEMQTQE